MEPPDEESEYTRTADLDIEGSTESAPRYLFTVDGEHPEKVLPLVCALVADAEADLVIGAPVDIPDQTSLEAPEPRREGEELAARYGLEAKQQCGEDTHVRETVTVGHGRDTIVETMIDRYDVSTFITQDRPRGGIRSLLGLETIDEASVPATCDTIIVNRIEELESTDSILVPISRGPHSELAIETGLALARQNDASIELLHVYQAGDADEPQKGEELLEKGTEVLDGYEPAEQTLLEADDIPETIIEHAEPFDITIFGAPREGRLRQFMLGTIPEEVSQEATGTVLIAHKGGATESWLDNVL